MSLRRSIPTLLAASFVASIVGACGGEAAQNDAQQLDDESEALKSGASFKCGDSTCKKKTQYCRQVSGPGQAPPPGQDAGSFHDSACEKLPTECAAKPSCDCMRDHVSGICSGTASSGLNVALLMM